MPVRGVNRSYPVGSGVWRHWTTSFRSPGPSSDAAVNAGAAFYYRAMCDFLASRDDTSRCTCWRRSSRRRLKCNAVLPEFFLQKIWYYYLRRGGCFRSGLSVCLCAKHLKMLRMDFGEFFWRVGTWPKEESIRFWWRPGSPSSILLHSPVMYFQSQQ